MNRALRFAGGMAAGTVRRSAPRRGAPPPAGSGLGEPPPCRFGDSASISEVDATLRRYAGLTRQELGRYLPTGEPSRYLYDLVASGAATRGKGLRPAICMATCGAFGGTAAKAVRAAVSFELLHAAFLVHDDVEDGSLWRRNRPTLNKRYNAALAVNAGDSLALLSLEPLFDGLALTSRRRRALEVLAEFQQLSRETIEGQAIELGWIAENVTDATFVDYFAMAMKKTSWYTVIGPCRVGALLGSRRSPDPRRFLRFGFFLGAMFQIQDDLRNLVGGPAGWDETPMSDIGEGKRTLMLIHLLRKPKPHADAVELRRILDPQYEPKDPQIEWVVEKMREYGSLAFAQACVRSMASAAVGEFEGAFGDLPPSPDKRFLAGLTPYLFAQG